MQYWQSIVAAALLGLVGCGLVNEPEGHGPQWIERPASGLVDKLGAPDRKMRLPMPSLSTVYMYGAGAAPGYALCEHDYFVRGETVIGYSEHGTAPGCNRSGGRTE